MDSFHSRRFQYHIEFLTRFTIHTQALETAFEDAVTVAPAAPRNRDEDDDDEDEEDEAEEPEMTNGNDAELILTLIRNILMVLTSRLHLAQCV